MEEYARFVRRIVDRRNRLIGEKLQSEYPHLRELPPAPVPEYVSYSSRVRKWSTIRVDGRTYSVPSRLIGMMVDVRVYTDHVEVYYKGHLVESMERIRGKGKALIDYRHIIGSLVRKPGAFARYRFREQMFPTHTFRLAYDAMRGWKGERADVDYVRILHLAATTMECRRREGAQEAAAVPGEVRLRGGEGSWPRRRLRRYRRSSCPARWTSACTTGCLREVRDDD